MHGRDGNGAVPLACAACAAGPDPDPALPRRNLPRSPPCPSLSDPWSVPTGAGHGLGLFPDGLGQLRRSRGPRNTITTTTASA